MMVDDPSCIPWSTARRYDLQDLSKPYSWFLACRLQSFGASYAVNGDDGAVTAEPSNLQTRPAAP